MAQLTPAQIEAIQARGNVLVEAGAGAGKTRTLVERCVACVSNPADGVSLDEILMVTFTEAAAAEMRQRLRDRLQEQAAEAGENPWLAEQLALVDTACISTLHSFCLQLVREHFYALELDPQLTVLAAEQSHLLEREALDALLQKHYAGGTPIAEAVQQLIFNQGRGWDQPVRNLVLRLHHYTQTLSDPAGWFRRELARLREPVPDRWDKWLRQGFEEWCGLWLPVLQALSPDNPKAASCAAIVAEFYPLSAPGSGAGSQREVARTSVSTGQGIRRDSQGSTGGAHRRDTGTVEFEPLVARAEIADALVQILSLDQDWPPKKKTALRAPLETFFEEAAFLHSVARVTNASPGSAPADPLVEDWNWVRPHMIALLELAQEFGERYGQAKHELGALDFHDLEQFALRLLRDPQTGAPSPVAAEWRAKFRLLFVDEYQDINEAQDAILQALGRSGPEANRFLVGDVKQSIYRFRLANPHIFQGYAAAWRNDADSGMVIPLADNFRSHAAILEFVNGLFSSLMQREVGGVEYDEAARLRFGAPEQREPMALGPLPGFDGQATTQSARVELHLRFTDSSRAENADAEGADASGGIDLGDLSNTEKEARLLGLRLRELKREHFRVWDGEARQLRPVEWRDMVILLRSPRYKSESYAKEFARLGVPLQATRGGFYESTEITDLLSLLQLLDNPLQDLPLLAVLRSPLVGLTLDELAQIRLVHRQGHFWTALQRFRVEISDFRFQISNAESAVASGRLAEPGTPTTLVQTVTEAHPGDSASGDTASNQTDAAGSATAAQSATDVGQQSLRQKVVRFLSQFSHWRSMTRQLALSQSLETILDETHYESWLITQSRGKQRQANVQRLLILTRQFDQFQRQGLFRFLKFVESQKEAGAEIEPASGDVENAVQLMSIHQSKGLEFPIVALADLGKPFNLADLRGDIIVDEEFGLCPKVKPPHSGQSYPSLPYWLAKRRQKRELLGEEIRLFYVACTRACDLLLLTGTVALKTAAEKWSRQSALLPAPQQLLAARSYLDWLGAWLPAATGHQDWTVNGQWSWLAWRIHKPDDPLDAEDPGEGEDSLAPEARADIAFTSEKLASLKERLAWRYPFPGATREPAKTSVSLLRRRASAEVDEEAQPFFEFQTPSSDHLAAERGQGIGAELTAAEVGTAHHAFMQWVSLAEVADEAAFPREADRLLQAGLLSAPERRALKLDSLARFWQSDVGQQILDHAPQIHRELPFTARFTPSDFARLGLLIPLTGSQGEETAPPSSLRADSTVAGTLSSRHSDPSVVAVQDEFIVVQGVVDLAVILPREIWLLDYKTDQLKSENIAEKTAKYRPQIALYALALSRIYQLPVTHRWLHFLTLGESVPL